MTGSDGEEGGGYGARPSGFRLSSEARPGRVRLQVADLERSIDWYGRVLGLRVLERSDGSAALGATGADEPLVELVERPGAAPAPRRGRPGLYHYAILLPDRPALGALIRHLSEIRERVGASDHFVSEALYLQDPDGLGIEVYADRPRSEWRHRDRQLEMATEPLDVSGVVGAAGEASWSGMPAGTTMGHVHLHVGDLPAAESFYHEALGLDKVVWSYPGALFLSVGGYHHHLGLNTWAGSSEPPGEGDAQLLEWEMVLPEARDVEAAASSLEAAGHGVERQASGVVVRDPWGTPLRIRPS